MDVGKIKNREITEEMKESYLDYAMSVIISRALPDVRDGLKPVHRRILYSMYDLGLTHAAKFRKSAAVVGEVMAKYHPHGDVSIYEALTRMAQNFSLRYPLVNGQGNFGCFTKDTKVKLTDGRDLSFEDLVKENEQGKKNYTYTINSAGLISITEIKKPRLTIKNAELIQVTLDNGEEIKCTLNHRFLLRNGSYKEAKDLKFGESLMPFYQKLSTKQSRLLNRNGYLLIYQNKIDSWTPAHHLADNYNLSNKKYLKSAGRVRHHVDFNKLNNNPDNVIRMRWGEHWKIHYQHASKQHKNPEYRAKIAEGRKIFWSNLSNKKKYAERMSKRNLENWQNADYRKKMRLILSEANKEYIKNHPEKRTEFSIRASKTMKKMWQDPQYRQLFHEKIVAANKQRTTNNTGKVKFLKVCKDVLNRHQKLSKDLYEKTRNELYVYGAATTWETGLKKYFNGDPNLVLMVLNKNHKVAKVKYLNDREDVYDLTIDKNHNFALAAGIFVHNSIDGDNSAAMRYTEARLTALSEELLTDIEKDTVTFIDNYDGSKKEPVVLPAKIPQLLLNGTVGIAVGMATNIPPHNLGEIIDGTIHLINHSEATTEDLLEFIEGPDFPTGGIIYNAKEIAQTYSAGRGAIITRGDAEITEKQIIIKEIPFQVNKSALIEKIAELVKEKRIDGIKDVRDESDREGMRIVIDLKADARPQKILNNLYRFTDLQKTFHLNMLALVDGLQPQVLSLKEILQHFIAHRQNIITRRTKFDLARTQERIHILQGLKKALDNIDNVIKTIKQSKDRETAQKNLENKFELTTIQAAAILEMRLQTLAGLERQKITDELDQKEKLARTLEAILKDPKKILEEIKKELLEIKEKFGDERKTKVVKKALEEFKEEDLVPEEETVIILTRGGYVKRLKPETYRIQRRGGKGITGIATKEEDVVEHFLIANTHDELLFFTDTGRIFKSRAFDVPEASRTAQGKTIYTFLNLSSQEKITALRNLPASTRRQGDQQFLVLVTKNGLMKKLKITDLQKIRASGLIIIKLKKDDLLKWVRSSSGNDEIILVTKFGKAIRFPEKNIRAMGRQAAGVKAMRLKTKDEIVGMDIIKYQISKIKDQKLNDLLIILENGYGKKTNLKFYRKQRRGGSGVITAKVTSKTGKIVAAKILNPEEKDLIAISQKGQVIRVPLAAVPSLSRPTQGVRIMRLDSGDKVASITTL